MNAAAMLRMATFVCCATVSVRRESRKAALSTKLLISQHAHHQRMKAGTGTSCQDGSPWLACQVSRTPWNGLMRLAKGTKNQPTFQPGLTFKPSAKPCALRLER